MVMLGTRRNADGTPIPRVIRRVTRTDKKGRPKIAYDRKSRIRMERITARVTKVCTYYKCPHKDRRIDPGTLYAAVTTPGKGEQFRAPGRPAVDNPSTFHPDCVPPEARPLLRFLFPLGWEAETWTGYDHGDPVKRLFTSVEAWDAWVMKNYPTMKKMFHREDNDTIQYGTNDYWSMLRRVTRTK